MRANIRRSKSSLPELRSSSFTPPKADGVKYLLGAAAVGILVGLAYSNSLHVPFLLDDFESIVDNPTIQDSAHRIQVLSPPDGIGVGGRPLLNLTYALDFMWTGLLPFGYHVTNLCIHLACAGFVFGSIRRTLRVLAEKKIADHAGSLALCITALWAVQPLQTISVTYISQRAESLMGLFFVAGMYCFIRSVHSTRPAGWYITTIVVLTFGVLVKEQAVIAPILFLIYDKTLVSGNFRAAWKSRGKFYLASLVLWVFLAVSIVISPRQQIGLHTISELGHCLMTDAEAVVTYIRLSIFPYPLVFDYGPETAPVNIKALGFVAGCVFFVAAGVIAFFRAPPFGFLSAWFFLILVPTTTVIPIRLQPIGENRVYLPSLAVILAVVLFLWRRFGPRLLPILISLSLVGAVATWCRNLDYQSEVALWKDTITKRPKNARAHLNLGFALVHAGYEENGIAEYRQAIVLAPNMVKAHYNLGCVLLKRKQNYDAEGEFIKALELRPGYVPIYNNLGFAQLQLGRPRDALDSFRKGAALEPGGIEVRINLGNTLAGVGMFDEAFSTYAEVIRLRPDLPSAYLERARLLRRLHRFDEAKSDYMKAAERGLGSDLLAKELDELDKRIGF